MTPKEHHEMVIDLIKVFIGLSQIGNIITIAKFFYKWVFKRRLARPIQVF